MRYRPKYKDAQGNLQDLPLDAETVKGVDVVNTKVDKSGDTMTGDLELINADLFTNYVRSEDNSDIYLEMYQNGNNSYTVLTTYDSSDWGFYAHYNGTYGTGAAYMTVDGGTDIHCKLTKTGTGTNTLYTHSAQIELNGDTFLYLFEETGKSDTKGIYIGYEHPDFVDIRTSDGNAIYLSDTDSNIKLQISSDDIVYIDSNGIDINNYSISNIYEINFSNGEIIGSDLEFYYNGTDVQFKDVGVADNDFIFTNVLYDNVQYPGLQFNRSNTATTYGFTADGIYFNGTLLPTANTNYYHTPSYNTGLKIGTGSGVNDLYVPTGNTASSVCAGNDTRLSDARTPTSHTHGNITNSGTITSTAVTTATGVLVYDSSNKIQRATAANARTIIGAGTSNLEIGTTATTAAAGNHTHTTSIASDTGTSNVTLGYGSKYKLTAGGTSTIFTTPSLGNTATTAAAGNHNHDSTYLKKAAIIYDENNPHVITIDLDA